MAAADLVAVWLLGEAKEQLDAPTVGPVAALSAWAATCRCASAPVRFGLARAKERKATTVKLAIRVLADGLEMCWAPYARVSRMQGGEYEVNFIENADPNLVDPATRLLVSILVFLKRECNIAIDEPFHTQLPWTREMARRVMHSRIRITAEHLAWLQHPLWIQLSLLDRVFSLTVRGRVLDDREIRPLEED